MTPCCEKIRSGRVDCDACGGEYEVSEPCPGCGAFPTVGCGLPQNHAGEHEAWTFTRENERLAGENERLRGLLAESRNWPMVADLFSNNLLAAIDAALSEDK